MTPLPAHDTAATATGQSDPAVAMEGVRVDYGDGPVLVDVDLQVARGEWVALVGPNGAGKSSALGVMTGLVTHDGTVALHGQDPGQWNPRQWARAVALVPQRPIIPVGLTVTDYALLGRTAHIRPFGVESASDLDAVHDAFTRLDLHQFASRPILNLSGGELQRVVLARALVQESPLMLLDEPTSALDVGHGQQVLELVDELRRDQHLTIVSAMHDLTLAGQFADRIVMLADGHIVADGTPAQVLTADVIARHYGATVRILHDERGDIAVVPVRSGPGTTPPARVAQPRPHVRPQTQGSHDD